MREARDFCSRCHGRALHRAYAGMLSALSGRPLRASPRLGTPPRAVARSPLPSSQPVSVRRASPEDVALIDGVLEECGSSWRGRHVAEELKREIAVVLVAEQPHDAESRDVVGVVVAWRVAGDSHVLEVRAAALSVCSASAHPSRLLSVLLDASSWPCESAHGGEASEASCWRAS